MNVCVFCSSSTRLHADHVDAATRLGEWIARNDHTLVWGGCNVGLMHSVGQAAHAAGGRTVAIVPEFLHERDLAFAAADELLLTPDMQARKALMRQRADVFVALPGGVGTWEEFFEVLALKKLQRLSQPLLLVNTRGFYDPLLRQLEHSYDEAFNPTDVAGLFEVAATPEALVRQLERATHPNATSR